MKVKRPSKPCRSCSNWTRKALDWGECGEKQAYAHGTCEKWKKAKR